MAYHDKNDPASTPEKSNSQPKLIITQSQKQALIDNLQLEITERARKLRAQYVLHAQGLRSRLELRINRIPQALRNANIHDLITKHAQEASGRKEHNFVPSSVASVQTGGFSTVPKLPASIDSSSPTRSHGVKRPSTDMFTASDKENVGADLTMPKKRAKTTTTTATAAPAANYQANTRATRTASRKANPSQVLSPKSNNSRPLPRSPGKHSSSPGKPAISRPVSPLKPLPPLPANARKPTDASKPTIIAVSTSKAKATATRPASRQAATTRTTRAATAARPKRKAEEVERKASNSSNTSGVSAGTTVVKRGRQAKVAAAPTATAPKKAGIAGKVAGVTAAAGRRAAAAVGRKEVPAPSIAAAAAPARGGRVLRTRK